MAEHAAESVHLSGPIQVFSHFSYRIIWYGNLQFEVFYENLELLGWTYEGNTKLNNIEKAINKAEDWWALGGSEEAQAKHRELVLSERQ